VLAHIARRLINTQAVRDSTDRLVIGVISGFAACAGAEQRMLDWQ
jgi:hypothetical protein